MIKNSGKMLLALILDSLGSSIGDPQIPSKGHLPKACIQVLLLRANDLGFRAETLGFPC